LGPNITNCWTTNDTECVKKQALGKLWQFNRVYDVDLDMITFQYNNNNGRQLDTHLLFNDSDFYI